MAFSRAERVARRRAKLRAAGLRPIQIWVPDTTRPGFAEECRRESVLIAQADATEDGRKEADFWERITADSWEDVG
jgi:Protein  of unknown function (DUF3018)